MSELDAIKIILNNHGKPMASIQGTTCYYGIAPNDMFYSKGEADKVIEELKAQKAQAEDDCAYWKMREGNAVNAMHETEEYAMQLYRSERHHKYKRCLDNARWCELEQERIELIENQDITDDDFDKLVKGFYARWHKRWLKLAEKFKPNKEER